MPRVTWTDVGPRDGLQNIGETVPTEVKVELVRGLLRTGVGRVEATSFVSPKWVPQLADAGELLRALGPEAVPRLRILIPNRRGLELALEHGARNVLFTIGATDDFNLRNVNRSVNDSLDDLQGITALAREHGCQVDVAVSVAFGCPFAGRVEVQAVVDLVRKLADLGTEEIGIADTIGVAHPAAVTEMVARCAQAVAAEKISMHFHDTRGLGVANVMAAYNAGIGRFDGSVGGLGGCPFAPRSTGNVCSEDALQALASLGGEHGCDLDVYCDVSRRLAEALGHDLPGKLYRAGVWKGETTTDEH